MSSEEPASDSKKVIIRRIIRREKDNFFGIDADIIHWVLTGGLVVGVGGLIANELIKKQQQMQMEMEQQRMWEQQQQPQQQYNEPPPQQVQEQQQQQEQPKPIAVPHNDYYPEMSPTNSQRNTIYDDIVINPVTEADGTRRKVKSHFGDTISIA